MELKEYIRILKQNLLTIVIFTGLSVVIGMLYSSKLTPGYKLEQVFFIQSISDQSKGQIPSPIAQLTDPSAMDEARNFTDTAVALLKSKDLNQSANVSVEKVAPQLIKVTVTAQNPNEAKSDMERVAINFNSKIENLIDQNSLQIKAVGSPPEAAANIIDKNIILALSFFIGLTLAVFIISLKNYFKL